MPVRSFRSHALPLVTLVALLGLGGCQSWLQSPATEHLPDSGVLPVKGLAQSVSLRRSAQGVALIESTTFHDALFALGYLHASDRLTQMVELRLLAEGRLAELKGPDALPGDRLMRALHLRSEAERLHRDASPRLRQFLEVYARGVNAALFRQRASLPVTLAGYRPAYWKPEDSALLFCLLDFAQAGNLEEEVAALLLAERSGSEHLPWLLPSYPDEPLAHDESTALAGLPLAGARAALTSLAVQLQSLAGLGLSGELSSQLAVGPAHSLRGRSLLAVDSHGTAATPLWHLVQLRAPRYQASGAALPGLPLLLTGFNGQLAWSIGRSMGDTQDLRLERLRQSDGRREYLADGQWLPLRERHETFFIRGQRPQRETLLETRHGTLLADGSELGVTLSRVPLSGDRSLDAFFDLSRADSVDAAHDAVRRITAPPVNLLYADARHIAWQVAGRYPNRRSGRGLLPTPGWDSSHAWDGLADGMLHPYDQDPPQGWLVDAQQRSVPGGYGVQLSASWGYPERAERMAERLAAGRRHDTRSLIALHYDQTSPFAARLKAMLADPGMAEPLARAIAALPATQRSRAEEALRGLQAFDGQLHASSSGAALYMAFLQESARQTFLDELGPEDGAVWQAFTRLARDNYPAQADHLLGRADSPFWDDINTSSVEDKPAILARSLAGAIERLETRLGSQRSRWQWGDLQGGARPGGDAGTPHAAAWDWGSDFSAQSRADLRLIVDFALDEPLQAQVRAQSERSNAASRQSAAEAMRRGLYQSLPQRDANLGAVYGERRLLLTPGR